MEDLKDKVLSKSCTLLVEKINTNGSLWEKLVEKEVISWSDYEFLTQKCCGIRRSEVQELINHLLRKPYTDFNKFKEALAEDNQLHVVDSIEKVNEEVKISFVISSLSECQSELHKFQQSAMKQSKAKEIITVMKSLQTSMTCVSDIVTTQTMLRHKSDQLKFDLSEKCKAEEELKKKLRNAEAQSETSDSQLKDEIEKKMQLQQDLEENAKACEELRSNLKTVEEQNTSLERQFKEKLGEICHLQSVVEKVTNEKELLEKQHSALLIDIKTKTFDSTKQATEHKLTNEFLRKEIGRINEENIHLKSQLEKLQNPINTFALESLSGKSSATGDVRPKSVEGLSYNEVSPQPSYPQERVSYIAGRQNPVTTAVLAKAMEAQEPMFGAMQPPPYSSDRNHDRGFLPSVKAENELELLLASLQRRTKLSDSKVSTAEFYMQTKDSAYPVTRRSRGAALVVTMTGNRMGWQHDTTALYRMLSFLNFDTSFKFDCTHEGVLHTLEEFIDNLDVEKCSCVMMIFCGHGLQKDGTEFLITSDEQHFSIRGETCKATLNSKNTAVRKIPKIFLVQICREEKSKDLDFTDASSHMANFTDYAYCFASQSGTRAYRHGEEGSWFIQEASRAVIENAANMHFTEMLQLICKRVGEYTSQAGDKAIPETILSLTKNLYFYPGLDFSLIKDDSEESYIECRPDTCCSE